MHDDAHTVDTTEPGSGIDWKKQFTTVTPFSKAVALVLFVLLPVGGFWLGVAWGRSTPAYTGPPVRALAPAEREAPSDTATDTPATWTTYRSQVAGGIELAVPATWYMISETSDGVEFSNRTDLEGVPTSSEPHATFRLTVARDRNVTRSPIDEWYATTIAYKTYSHATTSVAGLPAVTDTTSTEAGMHGWTNYYLTRGSDIVTVTYRSDQPAFAPVYAHMLRSLRFVAGDGEGQRTVASSTYRPYADGALQVEYPDAWSLLPNSGGEPGNDELMFSAHTDGVPIVRIFRTTTPFDAVVCPMGIHVADCAVTTNENGLTVATEVHYGMRELVEQRTRIAYFNVSDGSVQVDLPETDANGTEYEGLPVARAMFDHLVATAHDAGVVLWF